MINSNYPRTRAMDKRIQIIDYSQRKPENLTNIFICLAPEEEAENQILCPIDYLLQNQ